MKKIFSQKQKGIFFALLSLLCVPSIKAQTWTAPNPEGTAFADSTGYYVYNVGGKSFLDRGADWSTMAALGSGSLITPIQSTTLWILQYDSSTRTLFPGGTTDGSVFTDNVTSNTWDVQLTDAVSNVYSIQVNSTYGGYNASQYLGASATVFNSNRGLAYDVRYNRAASEYTQWKFCTAEAYAKYNAQVQLDKYMKIAQLVGSSVDLTSYITTYNTGTTAEINTAATNLSVALAPTDKTSSITNPNFDTDITGWTASTGSAYNFTEVEYWQKNFDFNQTLTGLPAGVYVVKVQGYERPVNLNTADHTVYTNGWDALNSRFYATPSGGTKTFQPLKNLYAETTCTVGGTVDGLLFPNSMSDAQTAFTAGLYDNELGYVTVDATGSLTIGISSTYDSNRAGRWNVFDNFRLYYYGPLAIPVLTVSKSQLPFYGDDNYLSDSLTVSGLNLSGTISITAPAGITVNPTSLASNATNAKVYVTYDGTTTVSGNITFTSGATTATVAVTGTPNANCFTPLYPTGNLIADSYCNSYLTDGWGNKSINKDPAYVYCGAASGHINGGSIDRKLNGTNGNGQMVPNTTYRIKAMVYAISGTIRIGVWGYDGTLTTDINHEVTSTNVWETVDFTFTTAATVKADQGIFFNNGNGYIDNWEMYLVPAITVAESSVAPMSASVGSTDSKTITVRGNDLTEGISLALSGTNADQFSVSTANLPLAAADSVATTVVTINYMPTAASSSHVATLTLSSPGAADKVFELSGSSIATGVDQISSNAVVYVSDKTLIVKGADSYEVFSVDGQRIAQKNVNSVSSPLVLEPGVYIVKTDKDVQKVIIK